MKKPPKKLSTAMRMALNDLAKVARNPKYTVDMDRWHRPIGYTETEAAPAFDTCHVCFAGAVMSETCGLTPEQDQENHDFGSEKWWDVFRALDKVRLGRVGAALHTLDRYKHADKFDLEEVVFYEDDPKQWRKDMWKIVRKLEKAGE